ncbi:MAG: glycosyltransferase family 8 protein [Clostridiales bacterium]|nr:glycosyltransferase family 8 protein [Clostridiales bacterium]
MPIKNVKRNKKLIPIFCATDDNYMPYLEVALRSLKANASNQYNYIVHVLNSGLRSDLKEIVSRLNDDNFTVDFYNVSKFVEPYKKYFKNLYHFTVEMYYRIFIEKMFPQYKKAIYLDCDITVLGDISKLFNINLGNNLVGAIPCKIIADHPVFSRYSTEVCGVEHGKYFNSGVLLMNLDKFRQEKLVEKFIYLINTYNFDVIDPDQAYLNVLTKGKVKILPNGWNKQSIDIPTEGDLNLVHYALYKKPWQYDDVINAEYFWQYAKESPFYHTILENKANFNDVKRAQKEKANIEIVEHAARLLDVEKTFNNCLFKESNLLDKLDLNGVYNIEVPSEV